MSTPPLVSIITPSYNQAQFLEQTIISVLEQDYPSIEYLIVDGSSTDGSVDIIRRYADHLTWWVSEKDDGQADAINKGMKHAKGDIVAWLNSDDLYLPGAVAQAANILNQEKELGMVFGDAISIDEIGRPLGKFSFGDWGLLDLMSFRIICQPAVFIRRSVLEQAGWLSSEFHFMLDHQLWVKIAQQSQIRHISENTLSLDHPISGLWAAARTHKNAKNVAQAARFSQETMQVLDWMKTQPDLLALMEKNHRRVAAGAYRLNARYLLDGDLPKKSLISYWRSCIASPSYGLKHFHRILFAVLKLLKIDWIATPIFEAIEKRKRIKFAKQLEKISVVGFQAAAYPATYRLVKWPGLNFKI